MMTLLLSSERSLAASLTVSPLSVAQNWFENVRQKRAQKRALVSLLAMEDHRLSDMGLSRQSIHQALTEGKRLRRA